MAKEEITNPRAPKHFSKPIRKWWYSVTRPFVWQPHEIELLKQACECLSVIEQAEAVLQREGLYIQDRFQQVREHPAQKTQRDNRSLFARLIKQVGLDPEEEPKRGPGRPGRGY